MTSYAETDQKGEKRPKYDEREFNFEGEEKEEEEEFGPDFSEFTSRASCPENPCSEVQGPENESREKCEKIGNLRAGFGEKFEYVGDDGDDDDDFGPLLPESHKSSIFLNANTGNGVERQSGGKRKYECNEIGTIRTRRSDNLDEEDCETLLEKIGLPNKDFYEYSLMHKEQVSHVKASSRTGFVITASIDGVVKFWKFEFNSHSTSLEYVKGFQAHKGEISDIALSDCGLFLASISSEERNYKLYNIVNFDMISIVSLDIRPGKCIFVDSIKKQSSSGYILHPKIAISDLETNNIFIYSSKGRSNSDHKVTPKYTNHKGKVLSMCYLKRSNIIISTDTNGGLEFWDPDTLLLPVMIERECEYGINFQYKIETDLFELQKSKTYSFGMTVSEDEKLLAIYCSDMKIRVFNVRTGRCMRVVDENISVYNLLQNDGGGHSNRYKIDHIEFGVRSKVENDIKNKKEMSYQTLCFDETCKYLVYPCILGICVFDVSKGKRVAIIGKLECGKRFLSIGLVQIHSQIDRVSGFSKQVQKTEDEELKRVNSAVLCSSLNSNRIYIFSKYLPLLEDGQVNLRRDIFNEIPSREEDIERQRLINMDNKKQISKRIAKSVILHTTKGDITLELFGSIAPKACENFSVHCFNKYYDNCIFHRVIKGFMIQSGDPTGDGTGGNSIWGKNFEDEFSPEAKHDQPFMLSMANAGPNTNSSQFFITTVPCPWLDGVHTVFGRVVEGKEYVKEIEHTPTNRNDKPLNDIYITSTTAIF
ncbi:cyclophilin like peptidyl-prolyl cis-trans isomerase fused to WD40 repeats at the N-terminus [Cryptosporidium ryanae]|uniref:cyclophilin like peptidyl-prolyl cis-trans isomerase fused to WD40 repeats at the N-terminus n=1 Tax=Cryptosporidium ryanae TaxID=515981 RepID=UPI003519E1EB|nr:cyclophilin like peptidyl-prolyl cis-trans isomerase fused to WD40 repeats at the N-terminus [Cryptosporidium ryanae]